jgi:hypothetical protein
MLNIFKKHFVGVAALALISTPVLAVPWIEVGDAGETVATAQSTTEPVTSISGSLYANPNGPGQLDYVDIYQIAVGAPIYLRISSGTGFALDAINDPVLYLFDQDGRAIVMNDDDGLPGTNGTQSTISPLNATYLPGFYYVAIAFAGLEPLNLAGLSLFDAFGSFGVLSSDPLASWIGAPLSPNVDIPGGYTLTLNTVPVSSGLLLLVPGLLGLGAIRRKISATS